MVVGPALAAVSPARRSAWPAARTDSSQRVGRVQLLAAMSAALPAAILACRAGAGEPAPAAGAPRCGCVAAPTVRHQAARRYPDRLGRSRRSARSARSPDPDGHLPALAGLPDTG